MPGFQVLVLKEHVQGENHQLDNRLVILYDSDENKFFYYGTRNNDGKNNYNGYAGTYDNYKRRNFGLFLEFLLGKYEEVVTIESHFLEIPESDYDNLCWEYFSNKMCMRTLLSAYDMKKVSVESVEDCLEMLLHV